MARISRTERFQVHLKARANKRVRAIFDRRVKLFQKDPYNPPLNTHPLKHNLEGFWSFSLTDDEGPDDYRVVFKGTKDGYVFYDFGTHDQLYRPWRLRKG